jgi:hypothetical protein
MKLRSVLGTTVATMALVLMGGALSIGNAAPAPRGDCWECDTGTPPNCLKGSTNGRSDCTGGGSCTLGGLHCSGGDITATQVGLDGTRVALATTLSPQKGNSLAVVRDCSGAVVARDYSADGNRAIHMSTHDFTL